MTEPEDIKFSEPMAPPPKNTQRPPMTTRSSTNDTRTSAYTVPFTRNPSITVSLPLWRLPQLNQHGHPVDVFSRNCPGPSSPINVEEALNLPAQPGTFRYQLENGKEMQAHEITPEAKKEESERVKNALRRWGQ
jgi:hypothetical protein